MSEHAILSPSKLPALALCPGRYHAEQEAKKAGVKDEQSKAASDGSRKHALAAYHIAQPGAPWPTTIEVDGKQESVLSTDVDDVKLVVPYALESPAFKDGLCGKFWIERKVEIGEYCGHDEGLCYGTFDFGAAWRTECAVVDWKFGRKLVRPANLQNKAYAVGLGSLLDWGGLHRGINDEVGKITLAIGQPANPTGPIDSETFPINVLSSWAQEVGEVLTAALEPNAPRTPGDEQCHFCLAKEEHCPERKQHLVGAVQSSLAGIFTPVETPVIKNAEPTAPPPIASLDVISDIADNQLTEDPETWTADELGRMCSIAPLVIGVLQEAQKLALKRALAGDPPTGWRVGKGKRSRDWTVAEEEREAALRKTGLTVKDIFPKKMATLAQLSAVAKTKTKKRQEAFDALWDWRDGKPVLVPEGDVTTPPFREVFAPVNETLPADEMPDWMK